MSGSCSKVILCALLRCQCVSVGLCQTGVCERFIDQIISTKSSDTIEQHISSRGLEAVITLTAWSSTLKPLSLVGVRISYRSLTCNIGVLVELVELHDENEK